MGRLFFTDAIQVLYMMKHFDVKFQVRFGGELIKDMPFFDFAKMRLEHISEVGEEGCEITTDDFLSCLGNAEDDFGNKFYVAPESEGIFEPKISDSIRAKNFGDINSADRIRAFYFGEGDKVRVVCEGGGFDIELKEAEIIMRSGKQFFMATREEK